MTLPRDIARCAGVDGNELCESCARKKQIAIDTERGDDGRKVYISYRPGKATVQKLSGTKEVWDCQMFLP